jgi:hypothetical protein
VVATILCAAQGVLTQDLWTRTYLDGEVAFKRNDFETAERKMQAVMNDPNAPTRHGPQVMVVGQAGGFIPEYYLALIYRKSKNQEDALNYARIAKAYFAERDDRRTEMTTVETEAINAVTAADNQRRADKLLTDATAEFSAGRLEPARAFLAQLRPLGLNATAANDLLRRIDAQEFTGLKTDAIKALTEKRYADARAAATRARALNVDNSWADGFNTEIARHETYESAMAQARQALTDRRLGEARTAATRARGTNVNTQQADAILGDITRHETFDGALAEATKAFDERRWIPAKNAADRARATNIDNPQIDGLLRRIEIQSLTEQITPLLTARSYKTAAPLVDQLGVLDPANPLVASARQQFAANLSADDKERLGLGQFYRGQYTAAIGTLTQLDGSLRPRARFYIAASRAALSLLDGDPGKRRALADQARQDMDAVRSQQAAFSADLRFLSPTIVQLLGLAR